MHFDMRHNNVLSRLLVGDFVLVRKGLLRSASKFREPYQVIETVVQQGLLKTVWLLNHTLCLLSYRYLYQVKVLIQGIGTGTHIYTMYKAYLYHVCRGTTCIGAGTYTNTRHRYCMTGIGTYAWYRY